MAGASVVTFLADKLGSLLAEKMKEEVLVVLKFKEEFESIHQKLVHIKLLLNDAGERRDSSQSMANWLQNLRDVLTYAMDLVEECEDADNAQSSILENPICNNPICHQIISLDRKFRQLIKYQKGRAIKELGDRIDKINITGNQYLEYVKSLGDVNTFSEQGKANSNSPLAKNDQIVGMQDDIKVITKRLSEENDPRVIAIWGMGGLGKSTMIRHVFDSEEF